MNNKTNDPMIGQKFGRLTILRKIENYKPKNIYYECECECGNIKIVRKDHLKDGSTKSCGCLLYQAKETTENLKEKVKQINPYLEFIDEPDNYQDRFRIKCNKCGGIFTSTRKNIAFGRCPICVNQLIVKGINDIGTKAPWMLEYFADKTDAEKYSIKSDKVVKMICPHCGAEKEMQIKKLYERGFSCQQCGDGISYPNKFVRAFLRQLPIKELTYEYSPNWTKEKIFYDNYFKYKDEYYFVEADGIQHYSNRNGWNINQNEKDDYKNKLAKEHNIQMIRINCSESSATFIENSIKSSILNKIFDLSSIDWQKCAKEASDNIVAEVSKYYEQVTHNIKDIAIHFGIGETTTYRYLNKGTEAGLCNYRSSRIQYNLNDEIFVEICKLYNNNVSIADLAIKYNRNRSTIRTILKKGTELNICNYSPNN